ncbi:MAG: YdcF family protein [Candidatus Paceibacteria bacterium]
MGNPHALILACDLTPDGTKLGPKTIARLERALQHVQETGERLVVAASWSPRHPQQSVSMAKMMAAWLQERGYAETVVREATRFNTRGELEVSPDVSSIISDPLHLRRARIMVRRMYGCQKALDIKYVATEATTMTTKGRLLEPLKCAFLYTPLWFQDGVTYLLHRTLLRRINLSY